MSKILVVEDDAVLALFLKKNIEQLGHKVMEVQSSGQGAINAVSNEKPDLIIMDIKLMGSIDGIQTMIEIRKFSEIPVIYVSGHFDESVKLKAQETQSSTFMSKPIDLEEFKERINKALAQARENKK
ncbi:MAG TPA: response regulator [Cytophagaceae bacterium]|jgi:DNA-binding response OmpR family regulator|nr:response regulator [Cytophagaceae bacterium]